MTIAESTINQLMNARHLYYLAKENLRSGQTIRLFAGVNLLHDAVEAMLWAVASHTGKFSKDRAELVQLFDDVDAAIKPKSLSLKPKIIALNKVRINSKHYGICPNKEETLRLLDAITYFLEETALKGFNANFWTISLLDLFDDGEVKTVLAEAQKAFELKDYVNCTIECRKVIFLLFECSYVIEKFKDGQPTGGLLSTYTRAPFWTQNSDWIREHVQSPFDYIQLDHADLDKELLKKGIEPSAFWNIWRVTSPVYRSSKNSDWLLMRTLTVEASITEEHAAYILEQTFDIALRVQEHNRKVRTPKHQNFFIKLRSGSVNLYTKADRSSKIAHVTAAEDMRQITASEGCDGFDGGYYWRVSHIIPGQTLIGGQYIDGFVHDDDVDWSEAQE